MRVLPDAAAGAGAPLPVTPRLIEREALLARLADSWREGGRLLLPASTSARRLARAALRRSAGRLGLPARWRVSGLSVISANRRSPPGPALHSLRFAQTVHGQRVLWSQIDVLVRGARWT